jgi:hypothetical protein
VFFDWVYMMSLVLVLVLIRNPLYATVFEYSDRYYCPRKVFLLSYYSPRVCRRCKGMPDMMVVDGGSCWYPSGSVIC